MFKNILLAKRQLSPRGKKKKKQGLSRIGQQINMQLAHANSPSQLNYHQPSGSRKKGEVETRREIHGEGVM